jgi:hypothetical protein
MGLIKKKYVIENLGVTIENVYAKIVVLTSEFDGNSVVTLQIKKKREDFDDRNIQPIAQISIPFIADKKLPLWEQGYIEAKKTAEFEGWIDDIV